MEERNVDWGSRFCHHKAVEFCALSTCKLLMELREPGNQLCFTRTFWSRVVVLNCGHNSSFVMILDIVEKLLQL